MGLIPTMVSLHHRHAFPTNTCPCCHEELEMPYHAPVQCRVAQSAWRQIPSWSTGDSSSSFIEWWKQRVRSCQRGTFSYMPTSTGNYGIIEICWYERVEGWVMHSLFTRQPRRPLHGDQSIMRITYLNRNCRLHLPLIGTHRKLAVGHD